jgi:hypothetical protein
MERYTSQNTSELRNKLRSYGYRGYYSMDKEQLANSVYVADKEHDLYEKFTPNPVDFSQFDASSRCPLDRYQRYISENDKMILRLVVFSGLFPDIDIKEEDVDEYRWVSIYNKKNSDEVYIHTLLKLKSGEFIFLDIEMNNEDTIKVGSVRDMDHANIVRDSMTNQQYYWYKQSTEISDQILKKRDLRERNGHNFSENVDNLIYLYFKFQEEDHLRLFKLQNEEMDFDHMKNFDKIYWVHLNLHNNDKSFVLYRTKDNVYTLIKFKYNMRKEEDIPKGEINMIKVYISKNYEDIINKALFYREYEAYMNETN